MLVNRVVPGTGELRGTPFKITPHLYSIYCDITHDKQMFTLVLNYLKFLYTFHESKPENKAKYSLPFSNSISNLNNRKGVVY